MNNKAISFLFISAIAYFSPQTLYSETLSGSLDIQIEIGAGCQVDSSGSGPSSYDFGTLDFGQYLGLDGDIDAETSGAGNGISITCSNLTAYTIAIDNGLNYSGSSRRLTTAGEYINYSLFQDASRTVVWGTAGNALSDTSDGSPTTHTVYGRIPSGQSTPSAGTYSDTVQVTLTW